MIRILNEAVLICLKELNRTSPGETEENSENIRIAGTPVENRSGYLPNISLGRYI
jgi:hypothetical protein